MRRGVKIRPRRALTAVAGVMWCASAAATPTWEPNGVRVVPDSRFGIYDVRAVTDGKGGAIVAWRVGDVNGDDDVSAQRVAGSGALLWGTDGVTVCAAADLQSDPQVATDGLGGAFVVWQDRRAGGWDVYARRVDAVGTPLWTADGVPVCVENGDQLMVDGGVVPDGSGGCVILWLDHRGADADIYAQRLDADGNAVWTPGGVTVCVASGAQSGVAVAGGAAGGAIVAWVDPRADSYGDIYAQRLTALGGVAWGSDGAPVCTAAFYQRAPQIVSPDGTGALVVWEDYRGGGAGAIVADASDIYAQHINAVGTPLWAADGITVAAVPGAAALGPRLVANGVDGFIAVWEDQRNDKFGSIFAQRVDGTGAPGWSAGGIPVSHLPLVRQFSPRIVGDGEGGAFVTWQDRREWDATADDIYAQRIHASGQLDWLGGDVPVGAATGDQTGPRMLEDGEGGALLLWDDWRNFVHEAFAQRIDGNGAVVPTRLRGFSLGFAGGALVLEWTVIPVEAGAAFRVFRKSAATDRWEPRQGTVSGFSGGRYRYADSDVAPGTSYCYRVGVDDGAGMELLFETDPLTVPAVTGSLLNAFPNPFSGEVRVPFVVGRKGRVTISVYDVAGRRVRTLVDAVLSPQIGAREVAWDGRDAAGKQAPGGVYFIRATIDGTQNVRKAIRIRR